VFLDIAWIKEKLTNSVEHIKKKLPSMYHQFKQLADLDITSEPMEVGPTTHYMMGGILVDADSQMTTVPGLFAAGECAAGLHGSNRLGGNSLSDLLVFGKRAGEYAAQYAKGHGAVRLNQAEIDATAKEALAPFERGAAGENPFAVQSELQDIMQNLVGIVRLEGEMRQALEKIAGLRVRAAKAGITGNIEYNGGWHTALDLDNMLLISEMIALAGLERKESRGGHFRDDFPDKDAEWGKYNIKMTRGSDGRPKLERVPIVPLTEEMKQVIEEQKS
jgi:succinate dehydrogenase / fumarate reductase flavoprotein subunit